MLRASDSGMEAMEGVLARFGDNRFVQSAVILLVALGLAWVADHLLILGLGRLTRRSRNQVDDRLIELLRRPVRLSLILAGLALVTLRLDPSSLTGGGALDFTRLTLSVLATLAIVLWMLTGVRLAALFLDAASGRRGVVQSRTLPLFRNLANVLVVGVAVYFVFVAWGIDVTAWLASAGIVGIAVGFAAKDTLANLFAGVFILTDAPYKVGDFIQLESGERGQVTRVGIRSTRIITRDDVEVTIPNSVIAEARIVNESGGRWTKERLRIKVTLLFGADLERVRSLLLEVARAEPGLVQEPEPRVRVRGFGDLGIDLELLAWIEEPVDRGRVSDALYSAVYRRFLAEGIEMPFGQRDLGPPASEADAASAKAPAAAGEASSVAGSAPGSGSPPEPAPERDPVLVSS
jgi:MscS family membrane protein